MIRTVIVDDEEHCTEGLSLQLEGLNTDLKVVEKFNDPVEALAKIRSLRPDLLFLDIQMPHLSGFELIKRLGDVNFKVVFTTAYDQYAIRAFEFSAFDYLLKPVRDEDLLRCLEKFRHFKKKEQSSKLELIMELLNETPSTDTRIAVPTSEGYEIIKVMDISHVVARSNYSELYFINGGHLLISRTLKEVEGLLTDFGFLRLHQSHLINPGSVVKILRSDGGQIVMDTGAELPASKTGRDELLSRIKTVRRR